MKDTKGHDFEYDRKKIKEELEAFEQNTHLVQEVGKYGIGVLGKWVITVWISSSEADIIIKKKIARFEDPELQWRQMYLRLEILPQGHSL